MAKMTGPLGAGSKVAPKSKPIGMVGAEPAKRVGNAIKQLKAAPGVLGEARDKAVSSNPITRGIRDVSRKALGLTPAKDVTKYPSPPKSKPLSDTIATQLKPMSMAKAMPQAPVKGKK